MLKRGGGYCSYHSSFFIHHSAFTIEVPAIPFSTFYILRSAFCIRFSFPVLPGVLHHRVECLTEVHLVAVSFDVAEVRRTECVVELKERVRGAEDRLLLVDVDGGET